MVEESTIAVEATALKSACHFSHFTGQNNHTAKSDVSGVGVTVLPEEGLEQL